MRQDIRLLPILDFLVKSLRGYLNLCLCHHTEFLSFQPALLVALFDSNEDSDAGKLKQSDKETSSGPELACKSRLLHIILQHVERATDFVNRYVKG